MGKKKPKKCKEMTEERAEELAGEAASAITVYIAETGKLGVGIVHGVLLETVAKLSSIFQPEDIVKAWRY